MRKPERQDELVAVLDALRAQVAELSERLAKLEAAGPAPAPPALAPVQRAPAEPAAAKPAPAAPVAPGISEEEILAVSAALAAYFGVRMRIRSIRLAGSPVWAQQGRVSIQASHRLHN
jgi:methylmalonyl-CoA carboxyltransferase large subunit